MLRQHLGEVFHELTLYKESKIVEGYLMGDRNHYMHQHSAKVSGIEWSRVHRGVKLDPNCTEVWSAPEELHGEHFWAREYFVSTVRLDENVVQAYIPNQKDEGAVPIR